MSRLAVFSFVVVALAGASSVAACSSIPDVVFSDAPGDGGGGGGGDGGGGDATTPGGETCDDGIDNNGDGKIDCADLGCVALGYTCQDVPAGWSAVVFAESTRPSCDARMASVDVRVATGDGASGTCSCSCSGGGCGGPFTLTATTENTCGVAPVTATVPSTAGCKALPTAFTLPAGAFVKIAQPTPGACNPAGVGLGLTNGRVCAATRFGGGCSAGQVCAPRPATGLAACIAKTGKDACPSGFAKRTTVGTTATDARQCTGCACNPPTPCTGGTTTVSGNSTCKSAGANDATENIGTTCAAANPDDNYQATHFESKPATGGTCTPTSPTGTITGAITFTDERTVCCK